LLLFVLVVAFAVALFRSIFLFFSLLRGFKKKIWSWLLSLLTVLEMAVKMAEAM
jgi:hypothetical protein